MYPSVTMAGIFWVTIPVTSLSQIQVECFLFTKAEVFNYVRTTLVWNNPIQQNKNHSSNAYIPKLKLLKNTSLFLHQCTFTMHRPNRTSDKVMVKPVHKGRWLYLLVTHSIVFKALKESLSWYACRLRLLAFVMRKVPRLKQKSFFLLRNQEFQNVFCNENHLTFQSNLSTNRCLFLNCKEVTIC